MAPAAISGALLDVANSLLPTFPAVLSESRPACEPGEIPSSRRLHLVLDLDHTLLHTTAVPLSTRIPSELVAFQLEGVRPGRYAVRLRDGLHAFLTQVSELAELHVYTMGARSYTREVLNIIDPKIQIFKAKVWPQ